MDSLLRDIAEYCHAEGRELQSAEIDMNGVLEEARRQTSSELQRTEAILTNDTLPVVEGDFFALATAFRDLIENACKFRSAAAPSIHVGCIRQGSEWLFSVRDKGLGFKPAYADVIFQPFKRLHGKQYPGSGLGLARAKRIVEQHDGRIWAESVPGDGSTFWFSLPVRE
jgi:light-regulated signal transduction histidine kinase (bacteriophytochrome)